MKFLLVQFLDLDEPLLLDDVVAELFGVDVVGELARVKCVVEEDVLLFELGVVDFGGVELVHCVDRSPCLLGNGPLIIAIHIISKLSA